MKALLSYIHRILRSTVVIGILVPIGIAIVPHLFHAPAQQVGTVQVQRNMAAAMFSTATWAMAGHVSEFAVTMNNQPVSIEHLQLRSYTLRNLSGRNLDKADFESPITITARPNEKLLYVGATPPPGHPPIDVKISGDAQAVISPTLLNSDEAVSINIVLYRPGKVLPVDDPYASDDSVLSWTADIKGAELKVVGLPKQELPSMNFYGFWLITYHVGKAVVALILLGFVLGAIQIRKFNADLLGRPLDYKEIGLLAARVTLAWITADVLVRMFDQQLIPFPAWNNWATICVYVVSMIFPLSPVLSSTSKATD